MEPELSKEIINRAIALNSELTVNLKNGRVKSGRPVHFINDTFLIIQTEGTMLKHDLILVDDIDEINLVS